MLVHADHAHDFITLSGRNASFTPATDHDADSHYRVTLTATDSKGVSASKTVTIVPQTIDLTIASVPAGAPITYAGYPLVAGPYRATAATGFLTTVGAAERSRTTVASSCSTSWSDGGAISHDVTIPAQDLVLRRALPGHRAGAVQRRLRRARAGRRQARPRGPAAVAQAGAQAGRHRERPGRCLEPAGCARREAPRLPLVERERRAAGTAAKCAKPRWMNAVLRPSSRGHGPGA